MTKKKPEEKIEEEFTKFFFGVFIPGIICYAILRILFLTRLDQPLQQAGFPPMVLQDGRGAISSGHGRFFLLIILSSSVTLPFYLLYHRFFYSET